MINIELFSVGSRGEFYLNFSDLRQVCVTPVSSTNKTDRHDITEILLKMALNT
jgi:hypothetical protein